MLKIARTSTRELILITMIIALALPYVYSPYGKFLLPEHRFSVTHDEILKWLQNSDASTVTLSRGTAGGELYDEVSLTVEFASPSNFAMKDIRKGILQKLKDENWTLQDQGYSSGPLGVRFAFYKGVSRWRLYVIEYPNKNYKVPSLREAKEFLLISIHDSKPDS